MSDASKMTRHTGHLVEGMGWTKDRPAVPGWYWFKGSATELPEDWCIFQVWKDEDDGLLMVSYMDQPVNKMMKSWIHGLWSGPIPLPSEAPVQGYYRAEEVEGLIGKQLEDLINTARLLIDGLQCDHSVGICCCGDHRVIEDSQRLLTRLKGGV